MTRYMMWRHYRDVEHRRPLTRFLLALDFRLRANRFLMHRVVYPGGDWLRVLRDPELRNLHRQLRHLLAEQRFQWANPYSDNYFYQGLESIGIHGGKPSGARLARYGIRDLFTAAQHVLDIGSNCGFWALSLSPFVNEVDGVECNPHLNAIAERTREFLGIRNARFFTTDFGNFEPTRRYDIVMSLSNHQTIDGNSRLGFEQYIGRIWSILRDGGLLLFESHNVWGPGKGGPGDDGDLEAKFRVASRHFTLLRYKMVECFYPADIDKLLAVFRKKMVPGEANLEFDLKAARTQYEFRQTPTV